jgi:hypothetical protein
LCEADRVPLQDWASYLSNAFLLAITSAAMEDDFPDSAPPKLKIVYVGDWRFPDDAYHSNLHPEPDSARRLRRLSISRD